MSLSIRTRIILVMSLIVAGITTISVITGITLTRRDLIETIKNDMGVSGVIAEQFVTEKVSCIKTDLRLIAEKCRGLNNEEIGDVLKRETIAGDYLSIRIMDQTGRTISYGAKTPYYRNIRNGNTQDALNGQTAMSTTQFDSNGDFVMRFQVPLDDGRILEASLPGMIISDMLSGVRIWKTGNIFILDHEGVVIANMRSHMVLGRFNLIKLAETDEEHRQMADVLSLMVRGETGTGEYSYQGVKRICAYLPIRGTDGWSLGVACPIAESPLSQEVWPFLIAGLLFLSLGVLAACFASHHIAWPFERIAAIKTVVESASEEKNHFLLLSLLEEEMQKPPGAVSGVDLLARIQNVSEIFDTDQINRAMEELEQYHESNADLIPWLRNHVDRSEFEKIREYFIPPEQEMSLFIEG
jgi:methyl-accepting chemotaxis protein